PAVGDPAPEACAKYEKSDAPDAVTEERGGPLLSRSPGTRLQPTTLPGRRLCRRIRIGAGILLGVAPVPRAHGAAPETPAMAGSPCPPAAVVQGPPEIVRPTVAILRGHGVTSGTRACGDRMVNASLAIDRDTGGFRLHVRDTVGSSSARRGGAAATQ